MFIAAGSQLDEGFWLQEPDPDQQEERLRSSIAAYFHNDLAAAPADKGELGLVLKEPGHLRALTDQACAISSRHTACCSKRA